MRLKLNGYITIDINSRIASVMNLLSSDTKEGAEELFTNVEQSKINIFKIDDLSKADLKNIYSLIHIKCSEHEFDSKTLIQFKVFTDKNIISNDVYDDIVFENPNMGATTTTITRATNNTLYGYVVFPFTKDFSDPTCIIKRDIAFHIASAYRKFICRSRDLVDGAIIGGIVIGIVSFCVTLISKKIN